MQCASISNELAPKGQSQDALGKQQEFRREGWTEKGSAIRFCLGSGLFGSYNSY